MVASYISAPRSLPIWRGNYTMPAAPKPKPQPAPRAVSQPGSSRFTPWSSSKSRSSKSSSSSSSSRSSSSSSSSSSSRSTASVPRWSPPRATYSAPAAPKWGGGSSAVQSTPQAQVTPAEQATPFAITLPVAQESPIIGPEQEAFEPSPTTRKLLEDLNWGVPEPEDPVKTPWELLKRKQAEKLTDHSYQVSEAEWDLIRQTYESAPGYRALNTIVGDTLLGADPVQPTPTVKSKNRSAPMTLKAYNALSPAQRAAVDFNTLLVGAREKDLNTSYAPTQGETKKYDRTVEKMFGEEGGSETYAPETVGLLKSIDFKGVGQDLDEYLSLERAVSAKELGDFKFTQDTPVRLPAAAAPTPQQYTEARRPENLATLDSTIIEAAADQIAEAMTSADTVMRDFTDAMLVQRYTDVQALGGAGGGLAEPEWGYGQPGAFTSENDALGDEFFKFVYDFTTDTKNTSMEPIWGYLDQYQFTPAETQQLFTYISDRAKNDKRYGDSEGSGNRRSPQQILQFAGIGG